MELAHQWKNGDRLSCAVAHPTTHENAPADSLEEATVDSREPGKGSL